MNLNPSTFSSAGAGAGVGVGPWKEVEAIGRDATGLEGAGLSSDSAHSPPGTPRGFFSAFGLKSEAP